MTRIITRDYLQGLSLRMDIIGKNCIDTKGKTDDKHNLKDPSCSVGFTRTLVLLDKF